MGAWNKKPFGNDSALDWLINLERSEHPPKFVEETLQSALSDSVTDSPEAEEVIAAAALVLAASTEPIGACHADAKKWIRDRCFVPDANLIQLAGRAVQAVFKESDLRQLWEESGGLPGWLKETEKLIAGLKDAATRDPPERHFKIPAPPRLLHRLIEHYGKHPSSNLREKIRARIDAIADVKKKTNETGFREPLTLVATHGLLPEAEILLQKGASPADGSAFVEACRGGHLELAERLRLAGAKVFSEVRPEATEGVGHKEPGYRYCIALYCVAQRGSVAAVEYLVRSGVDINQTMLNEENALHTASEAGNVEVMEFLLASGLDVNGRKGANAESSLHLAVRARRVDAVKCLLNHAADPNLIEKFEGIENWWYSTPLDLVDDEKESGIYSLLRAHGAKTAIEIMGDEYFVHGAKIVLARVQAHYVAEHEYAPANPESFSGLNNDFYLKTQRDLEGLGFEFVTDKENRTISSQGLVSFVRTMWHSKTNVVAAFYWLPVRPKRGICEFETFMSDENFVVTTVSDKGISITEYPTIHQEHADEGTPISVLYQLHCKQVASYTRKKPGAVPVPVNSYDASVRMQNLMNRQKHERLKSIGWVTVEWLLALNNGDAIKANGVYKAAQRLLAAHCHNSG